MSTVSEARRQQRERREAKATRQDAPEHPLACLCVACEVQRAVKWATRNAGRETRVRFSPFDSSTWGGRR